MAVQVAQAADPNAHPAATTAQYKDEMLSPVSKLEAARKQAAVEQQKRVEEAVARMASVKSENAGKRKLLEEKLDAVHTKVKVQKTSTRTESKRSAAVTTSAMSATAAAVAVTTKTAATMTTTQTQVVESAAAATVSSTSEPKTTQQPAHKQQTKTVSASYDATAELLRATRSKLNDLVSDDQATDASAPAASDETDKASEAVTDDDWNGPSTSYHLKQLGLVKKKIDIYAPVEVQQQEIRRLRDRSRFAPKPFVATADDHDSENDSDFTPEAASASVSDGDNNVDDDDSDAESIPEVEPEETLELAKESAEYEQQLHQQALLRKLPLVLLLVCVAFVLVLASVEIAQQQLQLCSADAPSDSMCSSFLQTREQVATALSGAWKCSHAFVADSLEAARASFRTEL